MLNLAGQRIFITGGSRGIGRAAALLAAEAGADVAIGYARDRAAARPEHARVTQMWPRASR
jgi:NAD(P)-dependent dehydrogenase (short-subunit alcohol dehydrogenase family)